MFRLKGVLFLGFLALAWGGMAAAADGITSRTQDGAQGGYVPGKEVCEKFALEYERGLATRKSMVAKLPEGSITALDVPYVQNPVKCCVPTAGQALDLYVPKGNGPFPLIVWIHGGGWRGGSKEAQGADLAVKWLPEGFAVASLSYRYVWDAPFPGMLQDCFDAIAWLRLNAAKYHLDADRVGVVGHSAGGHLSGVMAMGAGAMSTAFANTGKPLQAAVLWSGIYDMTLESGLWPKGSFMTNSNDGFYYMYPGRKYDAEIAKKMSPVYLIHDKVPPVLLIHGVKDPLIPIAQANKFAEALRKAGREVTLSAYPEYDHNVWKKDVLEETLAFFKKTLRVAR